MAERRRCISAIRLQLEHGKDAILTSATDLEHVKEAQKEGVENGIHTTDVSNLIADELGKITSLALDQQYLKGLILIGGDTAKSVCRNSGINGILLYQEIETGIPLGQFQGMENVLVVTKAGAFGSENSLIKALETIKGENTNV